MKTFSTMAILLATIFFTSCATHSNNSLAATHKKDKHWSSHTHYTVHSSTMLVSSSGNLVGAAPSRSGGK